MKKVFTILAMLMYWSERIQPAGLHRHQKSKDTTDAMGTDAQREMICMIAINGKH